MGLWPRPGQSAQSFHSHRDWSADGLVIQFGSIRLNLRLSGKTEKKFSFCCTRRCKLSSSEILRETELTRRTVETSDREGPGPHDTLELLDLALLALPLNSFFKCASTLSSFYCSGFSYLEFCAFFSSCHISRSLTATGIQRFNSILFNSIQFWHYLELVQTPRVEGLSPTTLTSLQITVANGVPKPLVLLPNLVINSGVLVTPQVQ